MRYERFLRSEFFSLLFFGGKKNPENKPRSQVSFFVVLLLLDRPIGTDPLEKKTNFWPPTLENMKTGHVFESQNETLPM
jgi:hypothetical protein